MKTQRQFVAAGFAALLFFCAHCRNAPAQSFKQIKILESTCEDVTRILEIDRCRMPESVYNLKDYAVNVVFTDGKREKRGKLCYEVPAGRVKGFSVAYLTRLVPLAEFGDGLQPVGRLKGTEQDVYQDKENGVSVFATAGFVTTAVFSATPAGLQKYAADCRGGKK